MSFTPNVPQLPHMDNGNGTSYRHEVNPAIALATLTNIYQKVQHYQTQLRQLTHKIRQLYAEGPIVSGWLASEATLNAAVKYSANHGQGNDAPPRPLAHPLSDANSRRIAQESMEEKTTSSQNLGAADLALFRHGDTDDLMNYLSALESAVIETSQSTDNNKAVSSLSPLSTVEPMPFTQAAQSNSTIEPDNPSQYYLCRLTSGGQIQTEPCPPEQVPVLSMAIARYQRLNQLTKQKQTIETKLQAIVDILGNVETILAD